MVFLTLTASVNVNAETCPEASGDTTITCSCDTGIASTGANLTIGTPKSGLVEVSNPGFNVISASGNGETTINNTGNGSIIAGDEGTGIANDRGTIAVPNNSGTISAGVGRFGIANDGAIDTKPR